MSGYISHFPTYRLGAYLKLGTPLNKCGFRILFHPYHWSKYIGKNLNAIRGYVSKVKEFHKIFFKGRILKELSNPLNLLTQKAKEIEDNDVIYTNFIPLYVHN